MTEVSRVQVWLSHLWWPMWPCFASLAGALAVERVCGQPYRLLPGATSQPALAWPLALLYLAAHLWLLAAYVITVQRSDSLLPDRRMVRAVWGRTAVKIWLMVAAFAIEYLPISIWRLFSALIRCP